MKPIYRAAFILAAAILGGDAVAQRGWEVVGSRAVGWNNDRDVIPVRGLERHRQIRLCAAGGAVRMLDLDIRFANGGHQDVAVRSVIASRSCTRAIDLAGQNRNITQVRILYERLRRRARPVIRVEAR